MRSLILLLTTLTLHSCVEPIHKSFDKLPPGVWRGVLVLDQKSYIPATDEEVTVRSDYDGELPFNFDIVYDANDNFHIELHNADETIVVDDIVYNRDKATAKDTIRIDFPDFDTYITAIYEEDIMEGYWHVPYKGAYSIPFKAYHGQAHRFSTTKVTPVIDLTGRWAVTFEEGTEDEYPAIGEFKQEGNNVTGTFLTETGDYRYLEGTVQGNKVYLSCFDAAHAFLFEAKVLEDGSLTGIFRSGKHYTSSWAAKKDDNVRLGDAYTLTTATSPGEVFDFSFPDLNGQAVSLTDEKFEDKAKLVKITGTWCPNCKDETMFLRDYFKSNPTDEVEVIEIAFERYKDDSKNIAQLKRYTEKLDLPFTMLYGGTSSKKNASEKLPQISGVLSYPTLIFVDRQNKIKRIHTGFSGPATSGYDKFKADFAGHMKELLQS